MALPEITGHLLAEQGLCRSAWGVKILMIDELIQFTMRSYRYLPRAVSRVRSRAGVGHNGAVHVFTN
jgi:hypothetical protein